MTELIQEYRLEEAKILIGSHIHPHCEVDVTIKELHEGRGATEVHGAFSFPYSAPAENFVEERTGNAKAPDVIVKTKEVELQLEMVYPSETITGRRFNFVAEDGNVEFSDTDNFPRDDHLDESDQDDDTVQFKDVVTQTVTAPQSDSD